MRVLFGDAGCGKTSVICWYLNQPQNLYRKIEVCRFADMIDIDWSASNAEILRKMLRFLNLMETSGLSGRTLILDGFDEVIMDPQNRVSFLNSIYRCWVDNTGVTDFRLMITCRRTYITADRTGKKYPYLILKPFMEEKAREYAEKLFRDEMREKKHQGNQKKKTLNIDGIFQPICSDLLTQPRVLTMLLANKNLRLDEQMDLTEVYDAILSPESGIYGLRIQSPSGRVSNPYDPWRSDTGIEQASFIDRISRKVALYIFRNSYHAKNQMLNCPLSLINQWVREEMRNYPNHNLNRNILSQGLFEIAQKKDNDSDNVVTFISDSIYLYFVTDTLFQCLEKIWDAGHYNPLMQNNTEQALLYQLQFANIRKPIRQLLLARLKRKKITEEDFRWWENLWARFLRCGMLSGESICSEKNMGYVLLPGESICREGTTGYNMTAANPTAYESFSSYNTYNTGEKYAIMDDNPVMRYIKRESMCFINMANIMQVIYEASGCKTRIFEKENLSESISKYLQLSAESGWYMAYNNLENYNLDKIDIRGLGMRYLGMTGTSVSDADMRRCQLEDSVFSGAQIKNTRMSSSFFRGSNFRDADLSGSICKNAKNRDYRVPDFSEVKDFTGVTMGKEDFEILIRHPEAMPQNYEYIYVDGEKVTKGKIDEILTGRS